MVKITQNVSTELPEKELSEPNKRLVRKCARELVVFLVLSPQQFSCLIEALDLLVLLSCFCFIPELQPYKYAGYPMLIKTIRLETGDDALFSKSAPLLTAASELAYHTINCSALNAEELRREDGIEVKKKLLDLRYLHCFSDVFLAAASF